ncbi:MAG: dihydropyrimidinase [Eubacteriaceae bacterium]
MNKKILIKNGTLVSGSQSFISDLLIEGKKITKVGRNLFAPDASVIDAEGFLVFPGFIDPHTHLDLDTGTMKTADNFKTGTRAAIAGGTTCILDFATQNKGETLNEALNHWHLMAQNVSSCDYGFHMAITDWNLDIANEIPILAEKGVTSYKLYMAYDSLRVSDQEVFESLKAVKKVGGIVGMHCENGDLVNALIKEEKHLGHLSPKAHPLSRPDFVEAEAINRFLYIAEAANAPVYIVHLSTQLGLEECLRARKRGQQVMIETCPQYLLLNDSVYDKPSFEGAKYVFAPPPRKENDEEALWEGLSQHQINTIGSDHCSFNFVGQKDVGINDFSLIPNGIPGVEHRPILTYTYGVCEGRITLEEMVALLSENVAKIFGMYPEKGALLPGSDADIVIWNPEIKGIISAENQHHNNDYTPYEGFPTKGRPELVLLGGEIVVKKGEIVIENRGHYVPRFKSNFS